VAYQAIHEGITELRIPELTDIGLVDVYEGEKIPTGSVSLTLRFTFQDPERTLTVDRVQDFIDTILSLLNKSFGAGLRSI
jgi:phenylalanyl-tRNA synthetase beta chain